MSRSTLHRLYGCVLITCFLVALGAVFWPEGRPETVRVLRPETAKPVGVAEGPSLESGVRDVPRATAAVPDSEATGALRGFVVDRESGNGVPNAWVVARVPKTGFISKAGASVTGPEGEYEVGVLPEGADALFVRAGGFLPAVVPLHVARVELERGDGAWGSVVDADGAPVGGVEVAVFSRSVTAGWPLTEGAVSLREHDLGGVATTNDRGEWHIHGLARGRPYRAWARKPGYFPPPLETSGAEIQTGGPAVLHLQQTTVLLVGVVDAETGVQLATRELGAFLPSARDMLAVHASIFERTVARVPVRPGWWAFLFTPRQGTSSRVPERFEVALDATAAGFAPRRVVVSVPRGHTEEATIRLSRADSPGGWGMLELRALRPSGAPYTGTLLVTVRPAAGSVATMEARFSEGRTAAIPVPAGSCGVEVHGHEPSGTWWPQPAAPVQVQIVPGSRPTGQTLALQGVLVALDVRDDAGVGLRGYSLMIDQPENPGSSWRDPWDFGEDEPGHAGLAETWVSLGVHRFHVRAAGFEPSSQTVELAEGATDATVRFTLRNVVR